MYRNNKNVSIKALFLGIMLCVFFAACDGPEKGSQVSLNFSDTVEDQQYIQDIAITAVTLPEAISGEGELTYGLAPLPDGLIFDSGTRELSGTPTAVGTTEVTYTARDEGGDEATLMFSIEVAADTVPSFRAPIDDKNYVQNTAIAAETLPAATDGNGDITYSLTPNSPATALPSGLTFDPGTRQLRGTPTAVGTTTVTYTARDEDGDTNMPPLTFMITVAQDLMPSFGAPIDNKNYIQNRLITAETLPAATGGNGTLTYSLTPPDPAGLTFTPEARELSGTPTAVGTTTVTYTATDQDGDPISLRFSIEVAANLVPSFGAPIDDKNYIQNTAISTETLPVASGGDLPLRYTASPLPDGITFDTVTRELSGTPTAAGTTMVTYTATDQDGDPISLRFSIEVAADLMPSFTVTIPERTYIIDGTQIQAFTLPEANGGNLPLSYTLVSLPDGLVFDGSPLSRQLTGIPAAGTAGTTTVTYSATDADGDITTPPLTFMITIEEDAMPAFEVDAVAGELYEEGTMIPPLQLPAAVGGNEPLMYILEPLPAGLNFDGPTQMLTGIPTVSLALTNLNYTVTDRNGDMQTIPFPLLINEMGARPSFGGQTIESPRVYVTGVTRGPFTLPKATGRDVPLTYSLSPLPDGMTFNTATRILSGTPTAASTSVTYTVTDADGQNAELLFTVTTRVPQDKSICARTQKVEDAILEKLHETDATIVCSAVSETELGGIDDLDLTGEAIASLQADDFDDLAGLTELLLGENSLTSLPEGAFDDLLHLERLNLENNGLATIPEGLFKGHSVLTSLTLDDNAFQTIPEDIFSGLFNLETLVMGNRLTALPEDVFDGLTSLETLNLHRNRIRALPEDVFDGLSSLTSLDLSSNSLQTTLPEDVFDGLTSLETLRLNSNDLQTLPANLFEGLTSLTRLDLRGNTQSLAPPAICMEAMVNCQIN